MKKKEQQVAPVVAQEVKPAAAQEVAEQKPATHLIYDLAAVESLTVQLVKLPYEIANPIIQFLQSGQGVNISTQK